MHPPCGCGGPPPAGRRAAGGCLHGRTAYGVVVRTPPPAPGRAPLPHGPPRGTYTLRVLRVKGPRPRGNAAAQATLTHRRRRGAGRGGSARGYRRAGPGRAGPGRDRPGRIGSNSVVMGPGVAPVGGGGTAPAPPPGREGRWWKGGGGKWARRSRPPGPCTGVCAGGRLRGACRGVEGVHVLQCAEPHASRHAPAFNTLRR